MGDLAIAPSDSMQIWAGTGEEDSRNSISPGGGIYKSTDGGLTWELKGLEATEHIGRIVVHPNNPDVVWVAALGGSLEFESRARSLQDHRRGRHAGSLVNFVSDKAGFVDVAIHPNDPDILFATSWERVRGPYFLQSGGPGSALWKSTDGGDTWEKVEGGGIPETELGRLTVAFAPSYPQVMYLMVEAAPLEAEDGESETQSGLYRSQDGGETWEHMNTFNSRPFYYSEVRVDPVDPDRVYFSSLRFSTTAAGPQPRQVRKSMSTTTPSGSIPMIRSGSSWATTAASPSASTREATTPSPTPSPSASSTRSATTWTCRTTSAGAFRTTTAGAGRAGKPEVPSPITTGSW